MATTAPPTTSAPTTVPPTTMAPTTSPPEYYSTCFGEYASGSQPSDWTERLCTTYAASDVLASASTYGCKILRIDHSASQAYALSWDDVGNVDDVEVLARVRWSDSLSGIIRICVRGSGTCNNETVYFLNIHSSSDEVGIFKYVNGATVQLGVPYFPALSEDTWYWLRFRVIGTSLKCKIWAGDLDDEPGVWGKSETDSSISSGWVGLGSYNGDASDCDFFSVATNGGTAVGPSGVCTTCLPTSLAPTTAIPTTSAPTTSAPTTLAPTSLAPTTEAPTTSAPTSLVPTSLAPTTTAPTSLIPTTIAPTTVVPTTAAVTTSAPTTSVPTTAAATTIVPTTVAPTTVGPTTLPPTTLAPSTSVPTTAGPTTVPPTSLPPTTNIPEVICVKICDSPIIDEILCLSPITTEIICYGNLC